VRAVRRSALALGALAAGLAMGGTAVAATGPDAHGRPPVIGYVLAGSTNRLDRLAPATDRMLAPVRLSWAPDAMAIAPGGQTAFVLTSRSAVWAVNLATGKAGRVTGVGAYPYAVAFSADGATAYVLTRHALVAVDAVTRKVLAQIPQTWMPDGQILQVDPRGHALFLLNIATGVITEVSTVTNTVLRQLPIGFCDEPGVFSPGGRWLYVPTTSGVRAVSISSGAVSAPVPVGECGMGALMLAPGGRALYAPGTGKRNGTAVTRIDVAGGRLTPAWKTLVNVAGGAAALALAPDGSTLYVTTPLRTSILPVSAATGAAGPSIADHLTGNWQMVIGGPGRYLFVSNLRAVAVISIATRRLVRTIDVTGRSGRAASASLAAGPGGQVFAIVDAGWIVPISGADGRAGPRIPADGQPDRIVFGRVP